MLKEKIEIMKKHRGDQYKPRTKHILPDGSAKYTNRLFLESSPYLLQHAHNPVNWYSWGDEAFDEAKRLNRPVLLSIGYSTCHWCHVMEEESFEDEEIAKYINENYIAIKVDREERPDLDSLYMTAVQAITGRGGWPMTVWLTPDRKPFYGGTYFPARDGDRGAATGFLTLLEKISETHQTKKDMASKSGRQITSLIRQMMEPQKGRGLPGTEILHRSIRHYQSLFDPVYGGLTGSPKFPSSLPIRLLLRYYRRTDDKNVLLMAKTSLDRMASGGIHDQVGGGFHRYSTDEKWLVPHFEKMLYDNALLAISYLEAYQVTGKKEYEQITKRILHYVKREMTSPEGGFYSATDADSLNPDGHREEGWFFTWTEAEIDAVLDTDQAKILKPCFMVDRNADFEGRHILHTSGSIEDIPGKLSINETRLMEVMTESREILLEERNKRPAPLRDEKILTSWNALMIIAYARAGFVLNDNVLMNTAKKAAVFILDHMLIHKKLHRSYKDKKVGHRAFLNDYAFLITAFLDLYETDHDPFWLKKALLLDNVLEEHFEDIENGGFYMTDDDQKDLIVREKPFYDGAVPSGNSYAVSNLLRLYQITTDDTYRKRAEKALKLFSGMLNQNPASFSELLLAVDTLLDRPREIIIVTPDKDKKSAEPFLNVLRNSFQPNKALVVTSEGDERDAHLKLTPLVKGKKTISGKTTVYLCEQGVCHVPINDPEVFADELKKVKSL